MSDASDADNALRRAKALLLLSANNDDKVEKTENSEKNEADEAAQEDQNGELTGEPAGVQGVNVDDLELEILLLLKMQLEKLRL